MNLKHLFFAVLTSITLSHSALADPLFTPQPNAPTATARVQGSQDTLTYKIVDGLALYSDIVLGTHQEVQKNGIRPFRVSNWDVDFESQSVSIPSDNHGTFSTRWPNNTVYYTLDPTLSQSARTAIQAGFKLISTKTAVCFAPRTNQVNYVRFFPGTGCRSSIGMVGGKQDISIGSRCESAGTVAHELLHALGWWHEQMRPDRDQYVTINLANIKLEERHNFDKMRPGQSDSVGSYDYTSIMHYRSTAFSVDDIKETIVPKPGKGDVSKMGQRDALSAGDIASVQSFYPGKICQPELKATIKARELAIDENRTGQLALQLSGPPEVLSTVFLRFISSSNSKVIGAGIGAIKMIAGSNDSERLLTITPVKNAVGESTVTVEVVPSVGKVASVTFKVKVIDDPSNNGVPPPTGVAAFSRGTQYKHGSRVSLNGKNYTLAILQAGTPHTVAEISGQDCAPESCTQSKPYGAGTDFRLYWVP